MSRKIEGIEYYTKAEVDQLTMAGYNASVATRSAVPVIIQSTDWTAQSGGDQDGWYYADVIHGINKSQIAVIVAMVGIDTLIHVCDGTNEVQRKQSNTTIRIWLYEQPAYDLLCLVLYA